MYRNLSQATSTFLMEHLANMLGRDGMLLISASAPLHLTHAFLSSTSPV